MVGAIVHEWFARIGGSEKVVEQMLETFPDSDLHVLWNDRSDFTRNVTESWLARTPLRRNKALALPFQLPIWRRLPSTRSYEWMLVSSHLFAHHARFKHQPNVPKLVYAHTPARYIWVPGLDRRGASLPVRAASAPLKLIDRRRSTEARRVAANSEFTRDRIAATWGIEADVIYPPVDVERISAVDDWSSRLNVAESRLLDSLPTGFLLGASRMIPYKRLDLVVSAGIATGLPVVLAGDGPLWDQLASLGESAPVPVRMIKHPSDAMLFALYQRCATFVFPAVEDFGIMPVEAMAAGAPVLTVAAGGAAESVGMLRGGAVLGDTTTERLADGVSAASSVDRAALRKRADRFSNTNFRRHLSNWVESNIS